MIDNGWIKINRAIQKHWLWDDPEKLKAWIDLIFLANYETKKIPYKGKIVVCEKGYVNLSISALAKRWDWSRDRTRNYLHLLQNDNMIVIKATTNRTTIFIVNYAKYQGFSTSATTKQVSKQVSKQVNELDNEQYNELDTTKEIKKVKKERINISRPPEADDEGLTPEEMMAAFKRGEFNFDE